MVAFPAARMVPAVAAKLAVVEPAGTDTEPCTGSSGLSLDRVIEAPPLGADPESVTMHEVALPELRLVGVHVSPVKAGVTTSAKVFEVTPLNDAVMLAEPAPNPVTRPVLLPIVATAVFEEIQVTCVVMTALELSL